MKMKRLEQILRTVERVKEKETEVRELMNMGGGLIGEGDEMSELLGKFEDESDELLGQFTEEYEEMRLDQVVVGAIAPIVSLLSLVDQSECAILTVFSSPLISVVGFSKLGNRSRILRSA